MHVKEIAESKRTLQLGIGTIGKSIGCGGLISDTLCLIFRGYYIYYTIESRYPRN